MPTLIQPDQTWLLWAVILGGVALSVWLEQTYRWAARLSGPVVALCIAMLLANLRIMPPGSPVYEVVSDQLVPLALPLLLFRADVFYIARTTGWLFVAFHVSAIGTVVGAITATLTLRASVPDAAQVAGIMTGSYIGGSVNFSALAASYHVTGDVTGPLLVADNFIMAGMFITLLLLCNSKWVRSRYPHPDSVDAVDSRVLAAQHWGRKGISLLDIAGSLAVAVAAVAVAESTAGLLEQQFASADGGPSIFAKLLSNSYVHITFWSTLIATVASRALGKLNGAEEMGGYLLYVYLFSIGLPADLYTVFTKVPMMFVFCLIMALANLAVTFAAGKLLRMNLEHLALSVNATLGGPPSAAAMAISMGWSKLVLPALLVGIWGYAIGTAVGLFVGELLRAWLGSTA